jgi:hypothetical protein
MKINLIDYKELLDFEKEIGYELIVNELPRNKDIDSPKFSARFNDLITKEGKFSKRETGYGNTVDEALDDYALKISGKTLMTHWGIDSSVELAIPYLKHTIKEQR